MQSQQKNDRPVYPKRPAWLEKQQPALPVEIISPLPAIKLKSLASQTFSGTMFKNAMKDPIIHSMRKSSYYADDEKFAVIIVCRRYDKLRKMPDK